MKQPLYTLKCPNQDNYFCRCKICKSALDHATLLDDNAEIEETLRKRKENKKPRRSIRIDF